MPPDSGDPALITRPSQLGATSPLGPVTMPGAEGGTQPISPSTVNYARSYAGVTPKGRAQADDILGKVHADARTEFANASPEYAEQEARAKQHFDQYGQSVTEMGKQEGQHWTRLVDLHKRISDSHETAAQIEAQIYEQGKQERAGYLSAYREQLAGVRALAATTGNPLGSLTTSQGLAMAAAQFAQGFLGAQGIHIDVNGQVDRWIDRSIQEHQMQIQNARQGAQDQLHLYDIARQTSEDDWEARQRFRGFVLAGFQSQIEAEGARYGSSIASERAKQKSAELQLELDKVLISIGDRRQNRYEQIEKRKLDEAKVMRDIAHSKEMERIGWAQVANARAKIEKPKPPPDRFTDPGATVRDKTGKVIGVKQIWEAKKGASELQLKAANEVNQKHGQAYAVVLEGTKKLRDLRPPAMDDYKEKFGVKFAAKYSEARREYDRQVTNTIMDLRHDIAGAALTDFERKEWEALIPPDSVFQEGDNASAIDQFESNARGKFVKRLEQTGGVRVLSEDEQTVEPVSTHANDTDARYDASMHGATRSMSGVDKAAGGVVDGNRNDVKAGGGFSPAYLAWKKATGLDADGTTGNREKLHGQESKIDAVDHMVALYLRPELGVAESDTVNGKATTDESTVKAGVLSALRTVAAGGEIGGKKPDDITQQYAKNALKEITDPWTEANPEAVYLRYARRMKIDEEEATEADEARMTDEFLEGPTHPKTLAKKIREAE